MADYNALSNPNLKEECQSRGIIPHKTWNKPELINELNYSDRFANYNSLDRNGLQAECQREGISLSTVGWNEVVMLHALKSKYLKKRYMGWMVPDLKSECQARSISLSNSSGKDVLIEVLVDHVWRVEQGNLPAVGLSTLDPSPSDLGPALSNPDHPSLSNTDPGSSNLGQPAGAGERGAPDDDNDSDEGVGSEG